MKKIIGFFFVISLSISGASLFPDWFEQLQKLILLVLAISLIALYGISKVRINLFLYFSVAVVSSLLGVLLTNGIIDLFSVASAFLSISTAFLLFSVRYRNDMLIFFDGLIVRLPFYSVLIGCALMLIGVMPWVVEYTGAIRLRGASIAPHLAMLSVVSIFSLVLRIINGPVRSDYFFLVFSFCVLILTATRGALVVGLLALLPIFFVSSGRGGGIKRVVIVVAVFIILFMAYDNFSVRNSHDQDGEEFNFSGRSIAWEFFFNRFLESPIWGVGLGGVTKLTSQESLNNLNVFIVPHNEYIRFLVDIGVVGASILLFGILASYRSFVRFIDSGSRSIVVYFMALFFFYSFFDNTFGTPQFLIPWFIFLACRLGFQKKETM